jgi:hypothetical protein
MDRERKQSGSVLTSLAVAAVLLLGIYVSGYFFFGKYSQATWVSDGALAGIYRVYPWQWLAASYQPLGRIEAELQKVPVGLLWSLDLPTEEQYEVQPSWR